MANNPPRLPILISLPVIAILCVMANPTSAGELPRGWKSATLDLSAEALAEAMSGHAHKVEHFIIVEESKHDSLNDPYHLSRYFEERFEFSDSLGTFRNDDIECFYELGQETCRFETLRKVTLAGGVFGLEGVSKVTFWQDLASPDQAIVIAEYVLDTKEQHANLIAEYRATHGKPRDLLLGRYSYLARTLGWSDDESYVLLCETHPAGRPDHPDRYSIVFGDRNRVRVAQEEISRLLRSVTAKKTEAPAKSGSLVVQSLALDESRCSFKMERRDGLNYAAWNWPVIKQHIDPEEYFRRFEEEAGKPYFDAVYAYFSGRRQQLQSASCRRLISSKEALWRLPFQQGLAECPQAFPSSQEFEGLSKTDQRTYLAILQWYTRGFGIPYPVFEIVVHNPTDEEILITHLSYELEYLDQLLPNIIEDPPMTPFVHRLDVNTAQPQTLPLDPIIAVPAGRHTSFRVKIKSTSGIGHLCKVAMAIVARTGAREELIHDEQLVFITVLSSMAKHVP